jgi:malate dehydrogenase (quinone)
MWIICKTLNALQQTTLFQGMKFSTDHAQIKQWAPLVMEGRDPQQKVAATWTPVGTDVNYGEITRQLIGSLKKNNHFTLQTSSEVTDFKRNADNSWHVTIKNVQSGEEQAIDAKYVFIGAGGGALKLLQKTGIPEADNYAGFPVGGSFLMTENPAVTKRTWKKCTVRPPSAHRRCRCRTLMPVSSTVSAWCCSGHSPPSRPSS